jgi:anti-sigma B factor antagonist
MEILSIETDDTQGVSVMKVIGRVDSDTAPELDDALTKLLQNNKKKIVLNLQDVNYMSSAGLRAMVKAYQTANKSGGDVHLAAVSEPIEVVLRTVGMMQMFKMFSSSEGAVAGF